MEHILPGLYASEPEQLDFGPPLEIRAFLLKRDEGNILIYRSSGLQNDAETITSLGGVERQYLNHAHEASPVLDWVASTFGAPLHVHADDAEEVSQVSQVGETFSERHQIGDLEVIPAPGHTPGATVYLWDNGTHRYLFTGDTIFFGNRRWRAAVLDDISDRATYLESLKLIRSIEFDTIVPSISVSGKPFYETVGPEQARQKIDEIIERVQNGEMG